MPALSQRLDTPAGAWPRGGKHSPSCTVEQPQALLDQSVLLAGFVVTTRHTCGCLVVVASTLHPSASDSPSLTRARTLSRPPSCTVEWWRVCSISRSSRVRSSSFVNTKHPKVLARTALSTLHPSATSIRRACTLSLPPPCTVEQPQSLLDHAEHHAGSVAKARHTCRCQWSRGGKHSPPECHRQTTSTHLESASTLHRGAAAKLARSGGAPCQLRRKGQTHLQVLVFGGKHSPPEYHTAPDTSTPLKEAVTVWNERTMIWIYSDSYTYWSVYMYGPVTEEFRMCGWGPYNREANVCGRHVVGTVVL